MKFMSFLLGISLFSLPVAGCFGSEVSNALTIVPSKLPKQTNLRDLQKEIVQIILQKVFNLGNLKDFDETKKVLRTLLNGLWPTKYTDLIFSSLHEAYGKETITKLILACEVSDNKYARRWIKEYKGTAREVSIPAANTTPVISAVSNGSLSTTRLLLTFSNDGLELKSEDGSFPLMAAAEKNNPIAVRMLLDMGAKINAVDEKNYTALHKAVALGKYAAAEALLTANANTEIAENKYGYTPLQTAISLKNTSMVRLLLRFKADPNAKNTWGSTPLVEALTAYRSRQEDEVVAIIQHLLQHPKIDVQQPGLHEVRPIDIVAKCLLTDNIQNFLFKYPRLQSR